MADETNTQTSGAAAPNPLETRLKSLESNQERLARAEAANLAFNRTLKSENERLQAELTALRSKKQTPPTQSSAADGGGKNGGAKLDREVEATTEDAGAEVDTHSSEEGAMSGEAETEDMTQGAEKMSGHIPLKGKARTPGSLLGLKSKQLLEDDEFRKAVEAITPLPPGYAQLGDERIGPIEVGRRVIRAEREKHGQYGLMTSEDMQNTYHLIHRAMGMYPEEGALDGVLSGVVLQ